MLELTIEEILTGPEYESLMNLYLDLREQEPKEIQIKSRFADGSGWRVGFCDSCGETTIVHEWHTVEVGGDAFLSLCPHCNDDKEVRQINGRYYLVKPQPETGLVRSYRSDEEFECDYDAHLIRTAS